MEHGRVPDALRAAVPFLICPHCGGALAEDGGTLRCGSGHTFDVARAGYVSLLPGGGGAPGDAAGVIAAREAFLETGHFDPIAAAVGDVAAEVLRHPDTGCIVDLGAGTGWYLRRVLDLSDRVGIAVDASVPGLRRAARAHPRAAAVRCDIWQQVPISDGAAALAMNIFAPRNAAEVARILRPDGTFLVVTPTEHHLEPLPGRLGLLGTQEDKRGQLQRALARHLVPVHERILEYQVEMTHAEVLLLVQMGPNAYHTDPDRLADQVATLPEPISVTVSVNLDAFRNR